MKNHSRCIDYGPHIGAQAALNSFKEFAFQLLRTYIRTRASIPRSYPVSNRLKQFLDFRYDKLSAGAGNPGRDRGTKQQLIHSWNFAKDILFVRHGGISAQRQEGCQSSIASDSGSIHPGLILSAGKTKDTGKATLGFLHPGHPNEADICGLPISCQQLARHIEAPAQITKRTDAPKSLL